MKDRVVGVVSLAVHPPFSITFPSSVPVSVTLTVSVSVSFPFLFPVPFPVAFHSRASLGPNGPFWKPILPETAVITPVAPFAEA